jgi:hypothetical protein
VLVDQVDALQPDGELVAEAPVRVRFAAVEVGLGGREQPRAAAWEPSRTRRCWPVIVSARASLSGKNAIRPPTLWLIQARCGAWALSRTTQSNGRWRASLSHSPQAMSSCSSTRPSSEGNRARLVGLPAGASAARGSSGVWGLVWWVVVDERACGQGFLPAMPVDVFEEPADRVDVVAARPSGLGRWVANAASHDSITARVSAAAGVSGPAVRPRWRASEQQPARSIAAVAGTMPRPSRQRHQKENQPHPHATCHPSFQDRSRSSSPAVLWGDDLLPADRRDSTLQCAARSSVRQQRRAGDRWRVATLPHSGGAARARSPRR